MIQAIVWRRALLNYLLFALMLCSSACSISLVPEADSKKYFVIERISNSVLESKDTSGEFVDDNKSFPLIFRVRDTQAGQFIDSQRIIFSNDKRTRGYYQYGFWVDPPPRRFSFLLESAFEEAEVFSEILRESSGGTAQYELRSEILEFFHYSAKAPGQARVSLRFELVDLSSRSVIGKKVFVFEEDLKSFDVEGAVDAFSRASNKVIQNSIVWVKEVLSEREVVKVN